MPCRGLVTKVAELSRVPLPVAVLPPRDGETTGVWAVPPQVAHLPVLQLGVEALRLEATEARVELAWRRGNTPSENEHLSGPSYRVGQ